MNIWQQLGFRDNPYDTEALPANREGAQLLVGRDREQRRLSSKLVNTTLHPTVEGANGVGKTSLVLVTAFNLYNNFESKVSDQLFIPINEPFQITNNALEFEEQALFKIGQTIVQNKGVLQKAGGDVTPLRDLEGWLNNPINYSHSGGAQIAGWGGQFERSQEVNTSSGFKNAGIDRLIKEALLGVFPSNQSGGLIGIIDNIELLSRSKEAKRVLERLRDSTLNLPGVRWVMCGSMGIIRASASSPRLTGRVSLPIEVGPVPDESIEHLVVERLKYFALDENDYSAPVGPEEFRYLYDVSNRNLRDALRYSQEFTLWLEENGSLEIGPEYILRLLEEWLVEEAEKINGAIKLQPRQWQLFDDLAGDGGTCAPGDYEDYGFSSMQRMRSNFAELERADLISAEVDEDDRRRRTVNLTSKGWIVFHARKVHDLEEN